MKTSLPLDLNSYLNLYVSERSQKYSGPFYTRSFKDLDKLGACGSVDRTSASGAENRESEKEDQKPEKPP